MEVDYIIVGQGLAGTLLASELLKRNKTIMVFDDPDQSSASEVAAGLINPVIFRRMTKSWMVDSVFQQMESTYLFLEKLLNSSFYFPGRMLKLLNEDEDGLWKEKVFANHLNDYLVPEPFKKYNNNKIISPFSFGYINKSGRLDIQKLIFHFSQFLEQKNSIRKEKFHVEKLKLNAEFLTYENILAGKIIFCEGAAASENPLFKNLRFKHSKGEILELKFPDLHLNEILNGDVFVMPTANDWYKIGATYSWDHLTPETTIQARIEILNKLKQIISDNPTEIIQKAGIRPTMHDRKPVIGVLPENPQVGIFNGFGSKGVLLAPYFANQFADYLIGITSFIHPEADIKRFYKHK